MQSPRFYYFADIVIDARHGRVWRGGAEQRLRSKTFQVLIYLVENSGSDVSKADLLADVWTDTAVVDDVLVQSVKDIRRALGDDTYRPRFIKTIPKVGYRFIAEVKNRSENDESENHTDYLPLIPQNQTTAPQNRGLRMNLRNHPVLIALSLILILYAVAGFVNRRAPESAFEPAPSIDKTDRKSLAIMFFENQSKTAELDWLREGLPDMLAANFSRSEKIAVLSRGQLHVLLERPGGEANVKIGLDSALELARQTGTELIIMGGFAALGESTRVDVQLYETKSGLLIGAESMLVERPEQILTSIDLLSLKLANRLGIADETPRDKGAIGDIMTSNLEAYRFYSLGVEQARALHNREAVELLEKAVAIDPKFAMAHARIGYAYAVTWNLKDEGKPHLERAFQLSDHLTEKDRLNIVAWYAIANLDYQNAIRQFRLIIAKYPFEIEAYERLARLLYGEGDLEEAIRVSREGLTIDSNAKNLYNMVGGLLSLLGRHQEAISMQQRYVALAPSEPNAYDSLGMAYQWAGDYRAAAESYNHALLLKPDFDVALVHLANTKFQSGQYKEAIDLYRRYLKDAPSNGERTRGLTSIATVYLKKRDETAAENTVKKLLEIDKDQFWAPFLIARRRNDVIRMQESQATISNRILTNRGSKNTQRSLFYIRACTALRSGQNEQAIAYFQESLRQLPPTWEADSLEDGLAEAYFELGMLDESAAEYERILELNPNFPLAQYNLARIYERKGLPEQAQRSYEQFLDIWKDADADVPEVIAAREFLAKNKG